MLPTDSKYSNTNVYAPCLNRFAPCPLTESTIFEIASSEKLILVATGSSGNRAERDSAQKSRVRPLNLIRIMPAEEECTIRPSGLGAAFFYLIGLIHLIPGFRCKDNWFQVSGVGQIAHSQEAGKL